MIRAACLCVAVLGVGSSLLAQEAVSPGNGAVLRLLDKLTGDVQDLTMQNGMVENFGRIAVTLRECRFPAGNPAGDAYAFVIVEEMGKEEPVFSGWMVGSSPALNPMDHSRYDVWPLRCTTS